MRLECVWMWVEARTNCVVWYSIVATTRTVIASEMSPKHRLHGVSLESVFIDSFLTDNY